MTKLSSANPHLAKINDIRAKRDEIIQEREILDERIRELGKEEAAMMRDARRWEKQNSPIKQIGRDCVTRMKDTNWLDEIRTALHTVGVYNAEVHPGWYVTIDIQDKHYNWTQDVYYEGRLRLRGPEKQLKMSDVSLGTHPDGTASIERFLPEINLWFGRMSQRG